MGSDTNTSLKLESGEGARVNLTPITKDLKNPIALPCPHPPSSEPLFVA